MVNTTPRTYTLHPDLSTPQGQLDLIAAVLTNPRMPLQSLNRLLQSRMAWRADRGLPPTFRRALLQLSEYLPAQDQPEPIKAKPKPKLRVQVDQTQASAVTQPADGLLNSSFGGHADE